MRSIHPIVISKISVPLAIFGIGLYLYSISKFAVNNPFWDDYDAILGFLNHLCAESISIAEVLKLFFHQHNEHRIAVPRLIIFLQYFLTKKTNFIDLIWIGNCAWILIITLTWSYAKKNGVKLLEFCPAIFIFTCLSQYGLMTWAMASVQQYYQLLFAMVSIWMMVYGNFYLSIFFLLISIFTGGGGLALIPIILFYQYFKKNNKNLLIATGLSILIIFIYFFIFEYKAPSHHPSVFAALLNPHKLLIFVLGFIGGIGKNFIISIIFGLTLLFLFFKRFTQIRLETPVFFWWIIYLIVSAVMVSISRSGFGIRICLSDRYAPYPVVFAVLTYLSILITEKNTEIRTKIWQIGFYIALLLSVVWDVSGFQKIEKRYNRLQQGEIMYPDPTLGALILEKSKIIGVIKE